MNVELLSPQDPLWRASDDAVIRTDDVDVIVELLWRDGNVPRSIDVVVSGAMSTSTTITLAFQAQFTADGAEMWSDARSPSPFHVSGPTPPLRHGEVEHRQRTALQYRIKHGALEHYSIWNTAIVDDADDAAALAPNATKLQSLTVCGTDVACLARLDCSTIEMLTLIDVSFDAGTLAVLAPCTSLRVLNIECAGVAVPLTTMPPLPSLTYLTVSAAIPSVVELPASSLPSLILLSLKDHDVAALDLSSLPSFPSLRFLHIDAKRAHVFGLDARHFNADASFTFEATTLDVALPPVIDTLGLYVVRLDEAALAQILAPVDAVARLDLTGAPIGDAFVEALLARLSLDWLSLDDTQVSAAFLDRLRAERPHLQLFPRLETVEEWARKQRALMRCRCPACSTSERP
ncbi:MAG TPA: hypothetical protein VGF99_17830 [Myxococcota bacterium]